MRERLLISCAFLAFTAISRSAFATVTTFASNTDWQAAAGPYSTITFTELPANTIVTNQYSSLGITFTEGDERISFNSSSFQDQFGLHSTSGAESTTMVFSDAISTIAIDFPGLKQIKLFAGTQLIYSSPVLGGSGSGFFGGLISTDPFDSAQIVGAGGSDAIDNLYFGPPIPTPAALALFGLAGLRSRRRRRA